MTRVRLPADHGAAGEARRLVGLALDSWPAHEHIVLAASELVTNAVQHGEPPIDLEIDRRGSLVRVTVLNTDTGGTPRVAITAAEADHGRGLALVERLAQRWGWDRADGRMRVWVEFDSAAGVP